VRNYWAIIVIAISCTLLGCATSSSSKNQSSGLVEKKLSEPLNFQGNDGLDDRNNSDTENRDWDMALIWFAIFACGIGVFAFTLWVVFDNFSRVIPIREQRQIHDTRDIELKKYELVYQEITRYRDMSWKVSGLAWAIYYGMIWINSIKNDPKTPLFFDFGIQEFRIAICSAAVIATIFLIWGEHSLHNNMRLRLSLERNLGLHENFSFRENRLRPTRPATLVSISLFLASIWLPVFFMLDPGKWWTVLVKFTGGF